MLRLYSPRRLVTSTRVGRRAGWRAPNRRGCVCRPRRWRSCHKNPRFTHHTWDPRLYFKLNGSNQVRAYATRSRVVDSCRMERRVNGSANPFLNRVINMLAGDVGDRARAEKNNDVGTAARRCRLSTVAAAVGAANPSRRACAPPLDTSPPSAVLPRALLRPLARQSRLLLQCLEKGSVRNKGQSAFSGGVFSQKRMRSWQYLSKEGNLNDNENAIRGSPLFCVRLGRILRYERLFFFITVREKRILGFVCLLKYYRY